MGLLSCRVKLRPTANCEKCELFVQHATPFDCRLSVRVCVSTFLVHKMAEQVCIVDVLGYRQLCIGIRLTYFVVSVVLFFFFFFFLFRGRHSPVEVVVVLHV